MEKRHLFLLPGQGAHFPGMGHDLYATNAGGFRELLACASHYAERDLSQLGRDMPAQEFIRSAVIQPLITAVTLGYAEYLRGEGLTPDFVAGHSLGEITGLGVCGVLSPEETIAVSALRGQLMDRDAATLPESGMFVLMFVSRTSVEEEIAAADLGEKLFIANINAPDQVVISGLKDAFAELDRRLASRGRCRSKQLNVAGPWHTPFLRAARNTFAAAADRFTFRDAAVPLILNATGEAALDAGEIRRRITDQLIKPVYWADCLCAGVQRYGCTDLCEIGPGSILKSTIRSNGLKRDIHSYYGFSDLEKISRFMAEGRRR
ncbi:MAG: ACP S-malonyltransferase [Fibrobacterota bacterium]